MKAFFIGLVLVLVVLALNWRSDARFWECNAARRQLQNENLENFIYFYNSNLEVVDSLPKEHINPDVVVALRDPSPHSGCWVDGETYKTDGVKSKVVVR